MSDIQNLLKMLQSNNPNTRYDACEQLRVASSIPEDALAALRNATHDANADVADAAARALAMHTAIPASTAEEAKVSIPAKPIVPMPSGSPNSPEYIFALEKRLMFVESELQRMKDAINQAKELSKSVTTKLPDTAIISPSFISRAFAVWGHALVAQIIIAVPIYCLLFLLASLGR